MSPFADEFYDLTQKSNNNCVDKTETLESVLEIDDDIVQGLFEDFYATGKNIQLYDYTYINFRNEFCASFCAKYLPN